MTPRTILTLLLNIPGELDLADKTATLLVNPDFIAWEAAVAQFSTVLASAATTVQDASKLASHAPAPLSAGGRPDGANRGGLMPPGV
jgi:hypothetical protein